MLNNRLNISGWLVASLVALGVGGLIVLIQVFGVMAALLGPGTGDIEPDAKLAQFVNENKEALDTYEKRFDGRSVFYIPPIKNVYVAPRPEPTRPVEVPTPAPAPPAPIVYTGPSVAFAFSDEVWFREPSPGKPMLRLRIGEEAEGITLLSTNLPKEVRVRQHGKEFTVPVMKTIDWASNPQQSLNDGSNRGQQTPKGMQVVGDDGNYAPSGFLSGRPAPPTPVQSEQTNTAAAVEEQFGPPVPDDLIDTVMERDPEPMPQATLELPPNDETDSAVTISTSQAAPAPAPAPNQDPEAESAAGSESGDTPGSGEDPGNTDPDNPGPPPE